MKKTKLIALFVAMLGILLVSCTRDITEPVMSSSPTAPAALAVSVPAQFNYNYKDSTFKFSWSAADFGFKSSTSYTVQLSTSSNFTGKVEDLVTTQNLNANVKVGDINTILISWNLPIGSSATLYYRVGASVSPNVPTVYTEGKSTALIPFSTDYPILYVPGDYQGWNPSNTVYERLYSYNFNSTYTSIVRLVNTGGTQTNFKVTSAPDWNHTNYGLATLTKTGSNYSGTCSTAGSASNFTVDNGMYIITIDVNALTISLEKTDDWGIIGSAIPPYDWSKDVNMNYNGKTKMWEITGDFRQGEFKFRANDDWSLNYGDNGADGTLDKGGANIALPADGNYTISFDPVALTYKVKKN